MGVKSCIIIFLVSIVLLITFFPCVYADENINVEINIIGEKPQTRFNSPVLVAGIWHYVKIAINDQTFQTITLKFYNGNSMPTIENQKESNFWKGEKKNGIQEFVSYLIANTEFYPRKIEIYFRLLNCDVQSSPKEYNRFFSILKSVIDSAIIYLLMINDPETRRSLRKLNHEFQHISSLTNIWFLPFTMIEGERNTLFHDYYYMLLKGVNAWEAKFFERRKNTWKDVWDQFFWYGRGAHFIFHNNIRTINPSRLLDAFSLSAVAYQLTGKKIAFLLPLQYFFKRIAWYVGYLKAHYEGYGHQNDVKTPQLMQ